jgi:hypothetical protein
MPFDACRCPLSSFRPPTENSGHRAANALPARPKSRLPEPWLLPWSFFPSSVSPHVAAAVSMARGPTPEPHAPSGFLDLLAPCSATCLPALFHAGSAHGVSPSEPCSSRAAVRRFPAPMPPCRCCAVPSSPAPHEPRRETEESRRRPKLAGSELPTPLDFEALLHTRVRHIGPVV